MSLPDEKREAVEDVIFGAIEGKPAHMTETGALVVSNLPRCYATPMAEAAADALAPLLAGWLAEARTEALREAADEVERLAQGLPTGYGPADGSVSQWLRDRAALAADAAETTGGGA